MAADSHLGMTVLSRVTLASAGLSCYYCYAVNSMLDAFKTSLETSMQQTCTKLQSFNKRISFASGRMEILEGLCSLCCDIQ